MNLSIKHYITAVLFFLTLTSSAQKVTFALLTDMHIDMWNSQNTDDLVNAVDEINANNAIEFILIAGKKKKKGDSISLLKAQKLLSKLKMPYYITFGNHDAMSSKAPNSLYKRIFGNDKFSFTCKGKHFIGFTTCPDERYGEGQCSKADLNWIDSTLKSLETSLPIIALTHYPLQKGDVKNWVELTDLLRKYNVQTVLNGHYHRNALLVYNQIPGIVNRSTLRNSQTAGGYSIYVLDSIIQVIEKVIGTEEQEWLQIPIEQKKYNN